MFLRLLTAGIASPLFVLSIYGNLGVAAFVLVALVLVGLAPRVVFGFHDKKRARWVGHVVMPLYDTLWSSVLLSLPILALVFGPALLLHQSARTIASISWVTSFVVAIYGVFVRRRWVRVRRVDVPIAGLDARLEGRRIVQLSDLHISSVLDLADAMAWVPTVNALDADLVVLTGDYVASGTAFQTDVVELMASLRARDGVFAVLGNHDYYDEGILAARLEQRGVHLLRNEGVVVREGALFLAGVEDLWCGLPDLDLALENSPKDATTVLLAHNPDYIDQARDRVDLVLSGHIHAGQIAVPFFHETLSLGHLGTRFAAGLFRVGGTHLFVHTGLGTTGPVIRIGAAPEIVELVLRRA